MSIARRTALAILIKLERESGYSNIVLDHELSRRNLPEKDKALACALVYGVTEKKLTLDYWIRVFAGRSTRKIQPEVLNILRMGIYQMAFMQKIPVSAAVNESVLLCSKIGKGYAKGFVNGVLRQTSRNLNDLPYPEGEDDPASLEIRYSCPKWLIELWMRDYGRENAMGILGSLGRKPMHAARVNTTRITARELSARLLREGVSSQIHPFFENALLFARVPELKQSAAFQNGLFHMQGIASQFCCSVLDARPGQTVLDLCASPGGKSFTAAEQMQDQGRVIACEFYENRRELINQGAKRLKLRIIETVQNDASRPNPALGSAQRVLCDVPCSGFGVIGSKPEIRYKSPEEIGSLPGLQYKILCEGAAHVAPGGKLVYSTCTLNKAENEEVALRFLQEHPEFEASPLPEGFAGSENGFSCTLFPHRHHTDGFFVAALCRKGPLSS